MRYYEVTPPGEQMFITTNARALRGLPDGTKVVAIITDYDGSLVETYTLPVKDGRVQFGKNGSVYNPKIYYGR